MGSVVVLASNSFGDLNLLRKRKKKSPKEGWGCKGCDFVQWRGTFPSYGGGVPLYMYTISGIVRRMGGPN